MFKMNGTIAEEQLAEKLKAAIPEGWTVRCVSMKRGSFILDCPPMSYYLRSVNDFKNLVYKIGRTVGSQPVTTCAYSETGEISTVFRIGSLKDPDGKV